MPQDPWPLASAKEGPPGCSEAWNGMVGGSDFQALLQRSSKEPQWCLRLRCHQSQISNSNKLYGPRDRELRKPFTEAHIFEKTERWQRLRQRRQQLQYLQHLNSTIELEPSRSCRGVLTNLLFAAWAHEPSLRAGKLISRACSGLALL